MKAVITVIGKDMVGILAKVSTVCAEKGINVIEVTQSILQDMFAMIMIVDISAATVPISELSDEFDTLGEKLGLIDTHDILETINMIDNENLDVRTITMGISLLDCIDSDIDKACTKVYDKICSYAENLVKTGEDISREYGIPIVNKRIAFGIIGLVHIFNPEMVLIGGGISREDEHFIRPLREKILNGAMEQFAKDLEVEAAALGNNAGLLGACAYFRQNF